ncbi:very short patch repair endonuclease [Mesorhizobium ventifaucium]|uniref:very short patch repair endonuclease n=1 Tax=Mesorhizobium ventifaucium TaxID=666020 RepID=UPI0020A7C3D7|nr:very short patch repair endonuclease [Mesorhizobium ventifaucium]
MPLIAVSCSTAPFTKVESRRVWGAESAIELFLFQELLYRGLAPLLQVLFYDDGSFYPSLYHLWRDIEFRHTPGMITEADMFFPNERVAVFCDSTKHHRGAKNAAKDRAVNQRLEAVGIRVARVPGAVIASDLGAAADMVTDALRERA